MAFFKVDTIAIAGIAACVPRRIVSNLDYDLISAEEREKLINVTGVLEKRQCDPGVTASDLCIKAAKQLLDKLGWAPEEIDVLVYVTQSRDYVLPNTAHHIQAELGLPKTCAAFDVPLGCSGYVYGLFVAANTMAAGKIKKGLFLAGESASEVISENDKSTYPLFGEAGTATALAFNEDAGPMYFNLQSDGSGLKSLYVPGGGVRMPLTAENVAEEKISEGIYRSAKHLVIDGVKVFEFTMREVAENATNLLNYANKTAENVDYFVMHQANLLMTEMVRKQLKIAKEKTPYSIRHFGNTSSASIPLTIVSQLGEQVAEGKHNWLLSGFGTGLSWGSCYIETGPITCPPLSEY